MSDGALSAADAPRPGERVDRFRVTRLVAEGAMGAVYLAIDEELGRRVALKFIKAGSLGLKGLDRFRDEARTTARFSHPHIVTVYAAGVYAGRPYLALEYLDGQTLRERLDETTLTAPEAMRIGRAVADALAEAHRHGVVHADLKPENVLLPRDGRVRVVDFGLARLSGDEATGGSGTPAYMAPERWQGGAPRPALDVWALGVLLHEMIEGRRPLTDEALIRLAYSPEPVSSGPKVLAAPCASLVSDCLRIDPDERPSATDVVARIDRLLVGREDAEGRAPFRGLEAFSEADAVDLQGRGADVDLALERLRTDALIPVVGPSGVGKSSFVFAGVVPRLREAGGWQVCSLRPGRHPWASLAAALRCETGALSAVQGGLTTELRRLSSAGHRVLLFIDQFEELVTLSEAAERNAVLAGIALAASPEEPWRIIVTLRADFLGAFAEVASLTPALRSLLVLRPLGRAALEEAVRAPLARVGHTTDVPTLPARIAAELDGQAAALPLLQFACRALWERRDAQHRVVLEREYDAMGGAVGALAAHAERLVCELLPEDRRITRALMIRLVNADGTRHPRLREELLHGLAPEASGVLDRLLTQRLLVSSRVEDDGQPLMELAHESLISTWPQLGRWLNETEDARTLVQELEQAAQLWHKRGRRDDETWVQEALLDVTRRIQKANVSLTSRPRDFLEAGRQRELRRARRRRWGLTAAFVTVSLIALGAGAAALNFREKERQAILHQEEIRLAAGDVGRFELQLEPFDWDAAALAARPVSAALVSALNWRLYAATRTNPPEVGALLSEGAVARADRHVTDAGALSEVVETSRDPVFFEFFNRGDGCGSSWLYVQALPGYAERTSPPAVVHLPVATCAASQQGVVRFDLPDGGSFGLDRTELTSEAWAVYQRVEQLTGDLRSPLPEYMRLEGARGLPLVGISAFTAERVCRFWGRRLPSVAEWLRATQRHPQRRGAFRECADGTVENLTREGQPAPVGTCPADRTPEGVVDLQGNVSEWTSDLDEGTRYKGFRHIVGSNWATPPEAPPAKLDYVNERPATSLDYGMGVRCASE